MALRSAHGQARKGGRTIVVEVPPADELSGVPAAPSGALSTVARTATGQIASREAAAELGRAGARRRAELKAAELRMLKGFGLDPATVAEDLVEYIDSRGAVAAVEVARVAREVGGGTASPSVAALVQQAGLALALSRHAIANGRAADGVKYGAEVRANVLAAHHLAALEARARPKSSIDPRLAPWFPAAPNRK